MGTIAEDLVRTLENEYKQLNTVANACREVIKKLKEDRQVLAKEIQNLSTLDKPLSEEEGEKIAALKKERLTLRGTLTQKTQELKKIEHKMQLMKAHWNFQKEMLELWGKENYYRQFLEETGLSSREALLQTQGWAPPLEEDDDKAILREYTRASRQDIATLLERLRDPHNHTAVFQEAQQKYKETSDCHYGFVFSYCLDNGFGTKADKKAAFKIDEVLANQNHPLALCSLANEYFSGDMVPIDRKIASELYQRAVAPEQQFFYLPHAMWGQRLLQGNGIDKDEEQGLHLLTLADQQGCILATIILMAHFTTKLNELEAAANTAAEAAASQTEIKHAQEQVYFYAEKADKLGVALGKYLLSVCYFHGYGVAQDQQRYLELCKQSATMGNGPAMSSLAKNYQSGLEGILDSDPMQSLTLYFQCLRKNHYYDILEGFTNLIANNKENLEFIARAYDSCKKCLQGHLLDNELDSTVMGLFYQHGILVPKNMEIAVLCFKKAADLGGEEAATALVNLSRHPEGSAFVSIALARKYFADADEEEIAEVRLHYETSYMPFFQALKQTWSAIPVNIPEGITKLIAEYADNASEKQDTVLEGQEKAVSISLTS